MEQITILIRDEQKGKSLLDLLRSLDFVSVLDVETVGSGKSGDEATREEAFFAAAGIWKGRDVTAESLRDVAWPRHSG